MDPRRRPFPTSETRLFRIGSRGCKIAINMETAIRISGAQASRRINDRWSLELRTLLSRIEKLSPSEKKREGAKFDVSSAKSLPSATDETSAKNVIVKSI